MKNFLFTTVLILACIFDGHAQFTYFVSPTGADANPGTSAAPFATIQKAIDAVKNTNKTQAGSTIVTVNAGVYRLSSTLLIDEKIGGNAKHPVTIKAAAGAKVSISGGIAVTGWTKTNGKPYFQSTLTLNDLRDLYVAGERRTRARTNERITGINWVRSGTAKVGMLIDQSKLPAIANPSQLEFHMQSEWRDAYVPIQSMIESNGVWDLRSNRLNEVTGLTPLSAVPTFTLPFYVENALELLDQPGEWFFDRTSKILYYYPKANENIATLEVIAPVIDKLIEFRGSSLSNKVKNVTLDGIQFAHAAWNTPSNEGWYGYQAEHLVRPSGVLVPPAAIVLNNASNIVIQNCSILNTAVSGVAFPNGVNASRIDGCYFFDTGGAAIHLSNRNLLNADVAGEEVPTNDTLSNNLIVRAGSSFFGSPSISSFYTDGLVVDHNTILQSAYTAISVGFGWEAISSTCKNNKITNNKIIDYLAICTDGGGIYTLGNQPNSIVENNYIKNGIRDWAALYFDQGTAFYTVRNNVVENTTRWLHIWKNSIRDIVLTNNWSNVSSFLNRGTNIKYESPILVNGGNWPQGAQNVINNSGFKPAYTWLTALLPSATNIAPTVSIVGGTTTRTIGLLDQLPLQAIVQDDGKPFGIPFTKWSKKSGPGTVTFPSGEQTGTLAFFSVPGTYELEFTVDDNQYTTKSSIQVLVTAAGLGANLALNKPSTASSSYDAVNYVASKAVDGNVNSIWVSAVNDGGFSTWTVDLGAVASIKRLELVARKGFDFKNTRQHLIFEVADEPTFASPILIANQGELPFEYEGTWSFNLPVSVNGRYIRMSHSRAGDNTIAEFRVFSGDGTTRTKEVDKTKGLSLEVFPNPVKNGEMTTKFKIDDLLGSNQVRLELYDFQGRAIQTLFEGKNTNEKVLNSTISTLSSGAYLLVLKADGKSISKKLVIQH